MQAANGTHLSRFAGNFTFFKHEHLIVAILKKMVVKPSCTSTQICIKPATIWTTEHVSTP